MKQIILPKNAPAAVAAYSPAVIVNGVMYMSGQIALHPATGDLVMTDIVAETRQVMTNITAILHEAKATFENVVKVTIFMSDMAFYDQINDVYKEYIDIKSAPAREAVAVKALPKGVNVEISLIAVL
jgi:2-iminobutanoate/2-iminopropanoate deaminase